MNTQKKKVVTKHEISMQKITTIKKGARKTSSDSDPTVEISASIDDESYNYSEEAKEVNSSSEDSNESHSNEDNNELTEDLFYHIHDKFEVTWERTDDFLPSEKIPVFKSKQGLKTKI